MSCNCKEHLSLDLELRRETLKCALYPVPSFREDPDALPVQQWYTGRHPNCGSQLFRYHLHPTIAAPYAHSTCPALQPYPPPPAQQPSEPQELCAAESLHPTSIACPDLMISRLFRLLSSTFTSPQTRVTGLIAFTSLMYRLVQDYLSLRPFSHFLRRIPCYQSDSAQIRSDQSPLAKSYARLPPKLCCPWRSRTRHKSCSKAAVHWCP